MGRRSSRTPSRRRRSRSGDKIVRAAIDRELPALKTRLESSPAGVARDTLAAQIAQLEALRVSGDPTLRIVEPALPPNSPVSPRPLPSILAGILAGLVLGVGAVFAMRMLDPLTPSRGPDPRPLPTPDPGPRPAGARPAEGPAARLEQPRRAARSRHTGRCVRSSPGRAANRRSRLRS